MKHILLMISIACKFFFTYGSVNYCGSKICGYTDDHTFCRYSPGASTSCTGYVPAMLSPEEKVHVITRLNKRRNEIAHGLRSFLPASDMLKLRWVDELERGAQLWADQCRPPATTEDHDVCRDLYSMSVGQCVASVVGEAPGLRPESMVDMWFMQSFNYKSNITEYLPSDNMNQNYDDFAQMTWSKTYMVGCGRSRFMISWHGRLRSVERLVCNFAPRGPSASQRLWSSGPRVSACPPRSLPDSEFHGLCDFRRNEIYATSENSSIVDRLNNLLLDIVLEIEISDSRHENGKLDELYLTRLTVDNFTSLDPFNAAKISFANGILSDDIGNDLNYENNKLHNGKYRNTNVKESNQSKKVKNQFKILGRQKSYEMEELNDITEDVLAHGVVKNGLYTTEVFEAYDDYHIDTTQEKVIGTSKFDISNDSIYLQQLNNPNLRAVNKSRLTSFIDEMVSINTTDLLNGSAVDEQIVDDYLSNPETARELLAAIHRMESKLQLTSPSSPRKMRREIRDGEENIKVNTNLLEEIHRNRTRSGPIVDVVLKYIPYLKPYEKNIASVTGSNGATCFNVYSIVSNYIVFGFILYVWVFKTVNKITDI